MSYHANGDETIKTILGKTQQYKIPRYQRKYIWDEKRWQDMYDDIKFIYQARVEGQTVNHFLSTFIFEKISSKDNGVDNYNIIDGQQRISTVLVILSAICRLYNEICDEVSFDLYAQYLVAKGNQGRFVKIDNFSSDLLQEIIAGTATYQKDLKNLYPLNIRKFDKNTKEEKNIFKCFVYFYNKIKLLLEWDSTDQETRKSRLTTFISVVLDMQAISIVVEDEQSGYDVFEILNARGTPLADHELLKNYIFKYYQPIANVDVAKKMWQAMEQTINIKKDIHISYFIDHYTTHKYEKPTTANNVLRIVKEKKARNDTKNILEDICLKAKYYQWFISPQLILENDLLNNKTATETIFSALMYFSLKNQIQFRPLMLSIFSTIEKVKSAYDVEEDLERKKILLQEYKNIVIEGQNAIVYLQNFALLYIGILNEPPKNIEMTVHTLAQGIENGSLKISDIQAKLYFKVSYDSFFAKFSNIGYSNKNPLFERKKSIVDIRQIMRMYELHLHGTDELTIDNMTIEHIKNDDSSNTSVVKIGNLLPLAEILQKEIGTETDFSKKVPIYLKSSFKTVQELCTTFGNQDWNEELINKRTESIAKCFYDEILKNVIK